MMRYYKPKTLIAGVLIFAFSLFLIGFMYGMEVINDKYIWLLVILFIGIFIGEGLILDAASYKVREPKQRGKE